MTTPGYEVFAIRYATRLDGRRKDYFIGGDPHDAPMVMDYFVWVIRNAERTVVVDTGFSADTATRRNRTLLRSVREGLASLDVDADNVKDVIITHLHYDHAGTLHDFPQAHFHLQDDEMAYASGRYMCFHRFSRSYEVEDVVAMVRLVFKERVTFYTGSAEIFPGISVHRIGGHTHGLQCVRVMTQRGWVVLASDGTHFYEHMETGRSGQTAFHVGEIFEGYRTLKQLAQSPQHVIPGHDPLVMRRYPPPSPDLEGIVARLDVEPIA